MENLCCEDKLSLVRSLCREHKITALEISKGSGVTLSTVKKFISDKPCKPQARTLGLVLRYIESRLVYSESKTDLVASLRMQVAAKDTLLKMQDEKITELKAKVYNCMVCIKAL